MASSPSYIDTQLSILCPTQESWGVYVFSSEEFQFLDPCHLLKLSWHPQSHSFLWAFLPSHD